MKNSTITRSMLSNTSNLLQWSSFFLLTLIIIATILQGYHSAFRIEGNDFTSYFLSAQTLATGGNPYDTAAAFPYIYPMTLAFFLIPFTWIPKAVAVVLWLGINTAALAYILLSLQKVFAFHLHPATARFKLFYYAPVLLLLTIIFITPLRNHLLNGQVNLIIGALFCLFVDKYITRQWSLSAVALALAIAIKLTPALLLFIPLFRKEFGFTCKIIALTVLFCMMPFAAAGFDGIDYYQYYYLNFLTQDGSNLGNGALIYNLPDILHVWLNLHENLARFISLSLVVAFLFFLTTHTDTTAQSQWTLWSISLAFILLLSPKSQKHHLVLLIPAFVCFYFYCFYNYKDILKSTEKIFFADKIKWMFIAGVLFFWMEKLTDSNLPWYTLAIICFIAGNFYFLLLRKRIQ